MAPVRFQTLRSIQVQQLWQLKGAEHHLTYPDQLKYLIIVANCPDSMRLLTKGEVTNCT